MPVTFGAGTEVLSKMLFALIDLIQGNDVTVPVPAGLALTATVLVPTDCLAVRPRWPALRSCPSDTFRKVRDEAVAGSNPVTPITPITVTPTM